MKLAISFVNIKATHENNTTINYMLHDWVQKLQNKMMNFLFFEGHFSDCHVTPDGFVDTCYMTKTFFLPRSSVAKRKLVYVR